VNNSMTIFSTFRVPVHITPGERFRVDADDGKVTIYYVPGVTRQRDIDRALQAAVLPPPEVRIEKEETERDAALVAEAEAEHRARHAESGWARAELAEATIRRISDIAGEAVGTDPSYRDTPETTIAVVEVLARIWRLTEVPAAAALVENERLRTLLRDVLALRVDTSGGEYSSESVLSCIGQQAEPGFKWWTVRDEDDPQACINKHKALLARLREAGVVEE
jgi:hypothetical protein